MSGSVSISRDLFDHGMFKPEPFTEREAWIWMIMAARWKSGKARVGDFVVDLDRGQFAASVRFMAKAWGWTAAKVQRLLERLKKMEMISSKTDTGVSVITVCNYDKFQPLQEATDTGPIQVRYKREEGCKKEIEKEKKEVRGANALGILSQVASAAMAERFIKHRSDMKKPITDAAAEAIVSKLKDHPDPDAVLNDSIANGWQGVFPDKTKRTEQSNGKPTGQGRLNAFIAGASSTPRMDSWPDSNPSQPLLARR